MLRPGIRSSARRRTTWARQSVTVTALAAATVSDVDLLTPVEVASASTLAVTVMRVHLQIQVQNWAAVTDDILFGLIVGRSADIGTNVAGQISPASTEYPWMLWGELQPAASGAAVDTCAVYTFDVKARRKMPELTQRLALCFLNQSAAAKTFEITSSVLLALP